jgi:hypothetical protein
MKKEEKPKEPQQKKRPPTPQFEPDMSLITYLEGDPKNRKGINWWKALLGLPHTEVHR